MACNNNGGVKPWKWPQGEGSFQWDVNFGVSECMYEVVQNEEDISCMFDETTPVKACGGDFAYNVPLNGTNNNKNMSKQVDECQQPNVQVKRRRMLQFDSQALDSTLCCEEASSAFLRSDGRDDSVEEAFTEASQWDYRLPDTCEDVDQSTARWLAECLNDNDMQLDCDDLNNADSPDLQIDVSEFWNDPPSPEVTEVQQVSRRTPQKIVFKGRKSYIRPPTKLASSVAYPFTFIKPSWVHGDVTLKDINQKIRTPPAAKADQSIEDSTVYPTSAFSGKPVVGKMKIRTEGGKGSITVMRTKG